MGTIYRFNGPPRGMSIFKGRVVGKKFTIETKSSEKKPRLGTIEA